MAADNYDPHSKYTVEIKYKNSERLEALIECLSVLRASALKRDCLDKIIKLIDTEEEKCRGPRS